MKRGCRRETRITSNILCPLGIRSDDKQSAGPFRDRPAGYFPGAEALKAFKHLLVLLVQDPGKDQMPSRAASVHQLDDVLGQGDQDDRKNVGGHQPGRPGRRVFAQGAMLKHDVMNSGPGQILPGRVHRLRIIVKRNDRRIAQ